MKMPKDKFSFEQSLLCAYKAGMVDGYAVEHTDIENEERKFSADFIARNNFKYSYDELRAGVRK